jgi:hypothetical protein
MERKVNVPALTGTKFRYGIEAGQFELYKRRHQFDGTVANPKWLG